MRYDVDQEFRDIVFGPMGPGYAVVEGIFSMNGSLLVAMNSTVGSDVPERWLDEADK